MDGIKVYTTPIELTWVPEVCIGRDRQWDKWQPRGPVHPRYL